MTKDDLLIRISALRGQIRRLLATYGLARVAALVLGLLLVEGWADWSIHLASPLRFLELAGTIAALLWALRTFFLKPLLTNFDDLAHRVVSIVFVLLVALLGWLMRRRPLFDSLIVYLVAIVAFAPAYSQQQLVLPLIALFVYATIELKVFYLLTLLFMIQNSDELGIEFFFPYVFRLNGTIYAWLQVLLIVFSLRMVYKDHRSNLKSKNLQAALKLN